MNYFNLTARGLLILYCIFLLLFAFGEGILKGGYVHAIPAVIIVILMIIAHYKQILGALSFFCLFLFSVWFFSTYDDVASFLIISVPLLTASILFFLGRKKLPAPKQERDEKRLQ